MTRARDWKRPAFSRLRLLALAGVAATAFPGSLPARPLPVVPPETVGFSAGRLQRLDARLRELVDEGEFAGIVTASARHGKIFHLSSCGKRDVAAGLPLNQDTLCRIYSMTKSMTAVAMMILYEEGKWNPHEPVAKYIPEFTGLKVLQGFDPDGKMIVEDPRHPPTMKELMTHTAGFSYGTEDTPLDRLYRGASGQDIVAGSRSLREMIQRLSRIPLLYQPGTRWVYSVSSDIEGYLVEKLSGQSLADFEKTRIFSPLGMIDTAYFVPDGKRSRFAVVYRKDAGGQLKPLPDSPPSRFLEAPTLPSGGGGLVSTASDMLRWAQALANGGELDGVRILGPETERLMASNHLRPDLMVDPGGSYHHRMRPGFGFGFGFGVFTDPAMADEPFGKGTFEWGGAAGTWFWIDPANDIVSVGMVQRMGPEAKPILTELARQLVYQALVRRDL